MTTAFKTDLKLELLKKGHAFSFFQIIRLLGCIEESPGQQRPAGRGVLNNIRVRPNLSMAFPAADVEKIEERDADKIEEVQKLNSTASVEFLSQFDIYQLQEYIDHLLELDANDLTAAASVFVPLEN